MTARSVIKGDLVSTSTGLEDAGKLLKKDGFMQSFYEARVKFTRPLVKFAIIFDFLMTFLGGSN